MPVYRTRKRATKLEVRKEKSSLEIVKILLYIEVIVYSEQSSFMVDGSHHYNIFGFRLKRK